MKTYDYKWIDFLSNKNVIKVTNEEEFGKFKSFLAQCGLLDILNEYTTFNLFQHLAEINNKKTNLFLFEYDNSKGLTWSDDIEKSIEWYGKEPIEIEDLKEFFTKKNLDCSINKNKEKRLCDLVEIEENNMECVLLKVKEGSRLDLIKLGCFNGDERLIRLTKGRHHTYTIFDEKSSFSWYYGESGYTIVSKQRDEMRFLIDDCIKNDFNIYIGTNPELIKKSLSIHCLADTYSRVDQIESMYWEGEKNKDVVVHKNGEFFKAFKGVNEAKKYFEKTGQVLSYSDEYIAETGCVVEKYSLVKEQYYDLKREELNQKKDGDFDYDY